LLGRAQVEQGDKEGRVSSSKHRWDPKHIYQQCRPETCLLANRAGGRESTDHCIYYPWMDKVIPSKLREKVFVYLDDLLIVTPDFESHLSILKEVEECLKATGLKIGFQKSHFCFKELRYLGFVIGGGELRTDRKKVEAIQKLRNPRNPREVRSLLGTAGWYRRFIRNFAEISAPLTDTLKKSGKLHLNPAA